MVPSTPKVTSPEHNSENEIDEDLTAEDLMSFQWQIVCGMVSFRNFSFKLLSNNILLFLNKIFICLFVCFARFFVVLVCYCFFLVAFVFIFIFFIFYYYFFFHFSFKFQFKVELNQPHTPEKGYICSLIYFGLTCNFYWTTIKIPIS